MKPVLFEGISNKAQSAVTMLKPSPNAKRSLLLALAVVLLLAVSLPASAGQRLPVHLRLYMHDIIGGPGQTAVRVIRGAGPPHPSMPPGSYFGDMAVIDDLLTEGPSLASRAVGRAQGTYVLASIDRPALVVSVTVMLKEGPYNGSSIVVAGRDDISEEVRELAVVGGTGRLRRATGHVLWSTAKVESEVHTVLELDVHATVPTTTSVRRHEWPAVESSSDILAGSDDF